MLGRRRIVALTAMANDPGSRPPTIWFSTHVHNESRRCADRLTKHLNANDVSPDVARKMAGKCNFLTGRLFGKLGRAPLKDLYARANSNTNTNTHTHTHTHPPKTNLHDPHYSHYETSSNTVDRGRCHPPTKTHRRILQTGTKDLLVPLRR